MKSYFIFYLFYFFIIVPTQNIQADRSWWDSFKSGCKKSVVPLTIIGVGTVGSVAVLGASYGPERDYDLSTSSLAGTLHARFWDGCHVIKESEIINAISKYCKQQLEHPLEELDTENNGETSSTLHTIIIDIDHENVSIKQIIRQSNLTSEEKGALALICTNIQDRTIHSYSQLSNHCKQAFAYGQKAGPQMLRAIKTFFTIHSQEKPKSIQEIQRIMRVGLFEDETIEKIESYFITNEPAEKKINYSWKVLLNSQENCLIKPLNAYRESRIGQIRLSD
ncbi:MAG: hypothetical protein WD068_03220 [Candidatus Babeliales bacterium]